MQKFFEDKQVMNPMNPEEVFTCKDLADGSFRIVPNLWFRLQGVSQREET